MKKISFVLCLLFCFCAHAEDCAGGAGTKKIGKDGVTPYCISKKGMNWWSAFAWCQANGMELFDMNKECNKVTGTSVCPQKYGNDGFAGWTVNSTSQNSTKAFYIPSWYDPALETKTSTSKAALCAPKSN